jgi:hypothetical protein
MMAVALQKLIDAGLTQPKHEPIFFQYPSGYDLVASITGYNTLVVSESEPAIRTSYAQLESSARRIKG